MNIIGAILIGGVVGAFAKLLLPGKDAGGIGFIILLGMFGGLVAGSLGRLVGLYGSDVTIAGISAPVLGATLMLLAYRAFLARRPSPAGSDLLQ